MLPRSINILKSNSFFLFGARGTGKTQLIRSQFQSPTTLWIDLLKDSEEQRYSLKPDLLAEEVGTRQPQLSWVIIDEVQKIPKLLDVVHLLIEDTGTKFGLTGSSARKLRRGNANLLAGRAFVYHLFPFTHRELGGNFDLHSALSWGTLPRLSSPTEDAERVLYLEAYTHTYLKEEILTEQLVRSVTPFRRFLEIAAQTSGTIVNYQSVASEIGSDPKTVRRYYEILEDTLIGFFLPAFHRSLRKQQRLAPKFYLFDIGVRRALERLAGHPLREATSDYGRAFEEFVICEAMRLDSYARTNFRFSYLRTEGGTEVDLVVERPADRPVLVEIKSSTLVPERHLRNLKKLSRDHPEYLPICLSREPRARLTDGVTVYPWQEGLAAIGL